MQIGNITINKYKCQWKNIGRSKHITKTAILHSNSLQNAINKAKILYGTKPTETLLIG